MPAAVHASFSCCRAGHIQGNSNLSHSVQHFELAGWRCITCSGLFVCALALEEPCTASSVVYLREDIYDCLAQPSLLHRAQEVEIVRFHLHRTKYNFLMRLTRAA